MTTRRQACYGLWLTALCCSVPLLAAAQDQDRPRVLWQAPAECPTQNDVEQLLERVDQASWRSVQGTVQREGAGYRLRLSVRGEARSFERELRAQTCDVLAESSAWLVELAATQLVAAEREPDRAEGPGLPEITHRATPDADSGADHAHVRLGFGAAAAETGLSNVSPHLALDVVLLLADWSVGLRLGVLLHSALEVAGGAEVDLQTNAAQLFGCRLWRVSGVSIGPCLAMSALRTSARTRGLTGQQASSASWLAAGPALTLQVRLVGDVHLGVELGGWAALSARPSFEVSNTTVARAGTLSGYARLGVAYELW